jgi:hypothetical protein
MNDFWLLIVAALMGTGSQEPPQHDPVRALSGMTEGAPCLALIPGGSIPDGSTPNGPWLEAGPSPIAPPVRGPGSVPSAPGADGLGLLADACRAGALPLAVLPLDARPAAAHPPAPSGVRPPAAPSPQTAAQVPSAR